MSHPAAGHRRPISPGIAGSVTITDGATAAQLRAVRDPDLSDSQADSAGSIPVIRSHNLSQLTGMIRLLVDELDGPVTSEPIATAAGYRLCAAWC